MVSSIDNGYLCRGTDVVAATGKWSPRDDEGYDAEWLWDAVAVSNIGT
jgi:hypothetical protein